MKLKKIEICGFKSFSDKIELKFESGITGIVGPNGCGKSNIADAIRWVMGEQSAKSLRGSSMQDVIFNGTEKRPSQSFSEVSIFLDNTENDFSSEYSEIAISRKLYRSGESEYLINRNQSRLKDIVDLFRDSGSGKEGYSVIGQGRIDEILSAKPEERRAVFEEAASISKFKNRKADAERKLERTKLNLSRIQDILAELERQLEPLQTQAEIAKEYLKLKEILKELELNIYIFQYDNASAMKAQIQTKISAISEELVLRQKEFEHATIEYEKSFEQIKDLDNSITTLRDELLELTVGIEKSQGESKLLTQKKDMLVSSQKKLAQRIENLESQASNIVQSVERSSDKKSYRLEICGEVKSKIQELEKEHAQICERIEEIEKSAEFTGNQMISALGELSDIKSEISGMSAELKTLQVRKSQHEKKVLEITNRIDTDKKEQDARKKKILVLDDLIEKSKAEMSSCVKETEINIQKTSEIENQIESQNAIFLSTTSRNKTLKEMQESNEGLALSVQKLLKDAKQDKTLSSWIVGVVAQMCKAEQKFETAIEIALGSAINNIVTNTPEDAEKLIQYLKSNSYGRATFLPVSTMQPRKLPDVQRKFLSEKGVLGVAVDLVSFDKKFQTVFDSLLGATVVTDNLENAIALAKKARFSFRIVTLDGDQIHTQGSLSGGSKRSSQTSIIGREREIQENEIVIKKAEEKLKSLVATKEKLRLEKSKLFETQQNLSRKHHANELERAQEQEGLAKLVSRLRESEKEKLIEISQKNEVSEKIDNLERKLKLLNSASITVESKKQDADDSKSKTFAEYERLKKNRETVQSTLSEQKVRCAEYEVELSNIDSEIARCQSDLSGLNFSVRETKQEKQQILAEISSIEREIEHEKQQQMQTDAYRHVVEIKTKLNNFDAHKAELQSKVHEIDSDKLRLSTEIQRLSDRKAKEEIQLSKVDFETEAMQERVWEEYELTYSSAIPFKKPDFKLTKGLADAAKTKKSIAELGNVNVNSIEDVKIVLSRYENLSKQHEDIQKAEEDLVEIIDELSKLMEKRFKEQFEKINENFVQTFKELFGGGRAKLSLLDESNLLESGIEISAEPPGKKLQSISLLSGGERALTAIAILFAILKLRPMPFCVLDEIEAALDDANAERFAKYLKKFSENTQFIVITHRKPTMELADSLYGITMEEKGVSKLVSVKFADAVKNSVEVAS